MKISRSLPRLPAILAGAFWLASGAALAEQRYDVTIEGAPNGLKSELERLSDLKKGVREYPTSAALRRAARRDRDAFDDALQAAGYYAGKTEFELTPAPEGKPTVAFAIDAGPAFKIVEYEILYRDDRPDRPATLAQANITPDGSAAGADLRDVQVAFLNHLWESGYPQAAIVARRAIANFEKAEAHAVFVFESGPKARFGEVRIDGLKKTKAPFVKKLVTWEAGAAYERSKIVSYRDRLVETGLFSTIDIAPGAPDEAGQAPVIVRLEERKRRTIGVGGSFSTSEGPGGRLYFENRNITGRGETLRVELKGSEIEQSINFDATKPMPMLPGQLFANVSFTNETTDAFDARSLRLSGGVLKRWLDKRLETRGSVAFETSNVKSNGDEERSYFVSTPLSALWKTEDDLLNPAKGVRAGLTVTPYFGTDTFTQMEAFARSRVMFGARDRFTLAGRAKLGATFNQSLAGLPLNKRFFAGGGASVRGFGFQEAGPIDAEGDPVGGRSLVEGAVEARATVIKNVQIAGFVDAGGVSQSRLPDFDEELFIGYGGGLRYFTPIGPIRVDVAFPIDPRPSDSDFQLYIAIGQPF